MAGKGNQTLRPLPKGGSKKKFKLDSEKGRVGGKRTNLRARKAAVRKVL